MICSAFAFPANALVPSDTLLQQQWYLEAIRAREAWDVTIGNPDTIVAVLDVGVDLDHPDLTGAIWTNGDEVPGNGMDDDANGFVDDAHGWDFAANDSDPSPAYDVAGADPKDLHHGTIVAGIIAARGNNGEGIAGIDWLAKIMPLRVLHADGVGEVEDVLAALQYARDNGATIVNLSFVGKNRSDALDRRIAALAAEGILVVAAGGNEDKNGRGNLDTFPAYPICSGDRGAFVLGVAATNERDEKATFSSYGSCVDLAAPGSRIAGTVFHDPGHTMIAVADRVTATTFSEPYGGFFAGTSYAAPIAAGAASLIRGLLPSVKPQEIIELLRSTADPVVGLPPAQVGMLGAGRVNLAGAVRAASDRLTLVPDAARSTLEAAKRLASVGEDVFVHVTLRDRLDRPIASREVALTSSRAQDIVTPHAAVTDGSGRASFTVQGTSEGLAELEATVAGTSAARGRVVYAVATVEPIGPGALLRGATASTVYLVGSDDRRYAFPDLQTFRSWYADTARVQRVSDAVLAAFPLGGLVTIRPGTALVKIQTDPKVYAVESRGALRWVQTEADAVALFGAGWARRVLDVPDAFFPLYAVGPALLSGTFPNGMLLADAAGERYLLDNGTARHFSSILAFLQNGFQHRDVITVATLPAPPGAEINGAESSLSRFVP